MNMSRLKDKQTRNYPALSRYSPIPFYYDTLEDKYIYGRAMNLSKDTSYTLHTLTPFDTLETLALHYYGRPDYYWIIANFNNVSPFIKLYDKFVEIKIPSLSYIYFGATRW